MEEDTVNMGTEPSAETGQTAVLTVGGVAFERRAHTDSHYARTPARARHGPSGGVGSCSKRFLDPAARPRTRAECPESVGGLSLSVGNHSGTTSH
jgi:hypothetical protein